MLVSETVPYCNIELSRYFREVEATCCRENKEKRIMSSFMDQVVCQGDGGI